MTKTVQGPDGGIRLYRNSGDRRRGVTQLKKHGYNYFTGYMDSNQGTPAGLSYGKAQWVGLFPYEKDI
jgi:hypothetical protein